MTQPNTPVSLSLVTLFERQFGVTPTFEPKLADLPARKEQNGTGTNYYAFDPKGREYFMPVAVSYIDDADNEVIVTLPCCVVGIRGTNKVIETDLTEREGTFDEIISGGNWEIIVHGFLQAPGNDFPEDDFKKLVECKRQNKALSMISAITDMVLVHPNRSGSDLVTMRDLDFPPVVGVKNTKPYTIVFKSTASFNLYEIE